MDIIILKDSKYGKMSTENSMETRGKALKINDEKVTCPNFFINPYLDDKSISFLESHGYKRDLEIEKAEKDKEVLQDLKEAME
jgi:hypothetical protein